MILIKIVWFAYPTVDQLQLQQQITNSKGDTLDPLTACRILHRVAPSAQPPSNNYNILQLSQYSAENKCNKTQIEKNYTHSDVDGEFRGQYDWDQTHAISVK